MKNRKLATKPAEIGNQGGVFSSGNKTTHGATPARELSSSAPTGAPAATPTRRRRSDYVNQGNVRNVFAALDHACHSGLTPNRHITINWEAAGVTDSGKATGKFLKLMGDCLSRRAGPGNKAIAYVWVREDGPIHGEHVHILVHIPPESRTIFAKRKAGWLKIIGAQRKKGISLTRTIYGVSTGCNVEAFPSQLYRENLSIVRNYILKHCSRDVQKRFGIKSAGSCELIGKRVSVSQNLNRKSRSKCGLCQSLSETNISGS